MSGLAVPSVQHHLGRCRRLWRATRAALVRTSVRNRRGADRRRIPAPPYRVGQRVWLSSSSSRSPSVHWSLLPGPLLPPGSLTVIRPFPSVASWMSAAGVVVCSTLWTGRAMARRSGLGSLALSSWMLTSSGIFVAVRLLGRPGAPLEGGALSWPMLIPTPCFLLTIFGSPIITAIRTTQLEDIKSSFSSPYKPHPDLQSSLDYTTHREPYLNLVHTTENPVCPLQPVLPANPAYCTAQF
ncbi:uncharacterized protein LOC121654336 [Melanotaenia boesemani]|uniref:uncharacterized protein LOC121654336 n=1 Tax=Melanotaenia boesemani TaxID=1250792 RepID=UPI001C058567|nr:uncharacterized protein LOC121654336 [Melanotaenia boesemani]